MSPLWWFCCTFALLANLDVFVASQCPGWYDNSAAGYPGYPPYPIVVKSKEKNSWKHILPIILLMMTDGGFGNSSPGNFNPGPCCCNGCCCCSNDSPIPIPFPIPIGINNPIVC